LVISPIRAEETVAPMFTACMGCSGMNKSPFRTSQMIRSMPECSCILAFDSQQRGYFVCADFKAKMVQYTKQHRKVDARGSQSCISQARKSHNSMHLTGVPILWACGLSYAHVFHGRASQRRASHRHRRTSQAYISEGHVFHRVCIPEACI
jgi:hypothetical protein